MYAVLVQGLSGCEGATHRVKGIDISIYIYIYTHTYNLNPKP